MPTSFYYLYSLLKLLCYLLTKIFCWNAFVVMALKSLELRSHYSYLKA